MQEPKNKYFKAWRTKKKRSWHFIQLKWYYTNRTRINEGWKKPESPDDDLYDKWARRFD